MCIVCIANNINRNVYMYLNKRIFPTTGYARVLLFMYMYIRRELGGTGTGCLFQFTYCGYGIFILSTLTLWDLETPDRVVLQTVKTQMKCSMMLHFIRVCTVC